MVGAKTCQGQAWNVRVPQAPLIWGLSSAGRASALQAEGHRFDPDRLHQLGSVAQVVRAHA
jgi:hypothetical protein